MHSATPPKTAPPQAEIDDDQQSFSSSKSGDNQQMKHETSPNYNLDLQINQDDNQSSSFNQSNEPVQMEPEVQESLSEFISKKTLPPPELRPKIYRALNKSFVNDVKNEDYKNAMVAKKTINLLNKTIKEQNLNAQCEQNFQEIETKLKELQNKYDEEYDKWETKIQTFLDKNSEKLKELEAKQENENVELEEKLAHPDTLRKFRKPSGRLLNLRKIEKNLVLIEDFQGAEKVRKMVDDLYYVELQQSEESINLFTETQRAHLREKQKKELICFETKQERILNELKSQQQKELNKLENQIDKYQNLLDEREEAELHGGKTVFFPKREKVPIQKNERNVAAKSPRTTYLLSNYRKADNDLVIKQEPRSNQRKAASARRRRRNFK